MDFRKYCCLTSSTINIKILIKLQTFNKHAIPEIKTYNEYILEALITGNNEL